MGNGTVEEVQSMTVGHVGENFGREFLMAKAVKLGPGGTSTLENSRTEKCMDAGGTGSTTGTRTAVNGVRG